MLHMAWINDDSGFLDKAVEMADRFYWNITIEQNGNTWHVLGGEVVLLSTDNREIVDAFLYGLGAAYSVLPDHLVEQFRRELGIEE